MERLQKRLPEVPRARKGRRLDLCEGLSPSPFKVRKDKPKCRRENV